MGDRSGGAAGPFWRRHWPALVAFSLFVAAGLLYSFLWWPVVHHVSAWTEPGDLFLTFRSAHQIAWGDIGDVYWKVAGGYQTDLRSPPAIAVLLAPVAALTDHLGLIDPIPFYLPHPSSWPVLAPVDLVMTAWCLFPLNRLAATLGVGPRRRLLLSLLEAAFLLPMAVKWGHPEDAIAVGLAVYGLLLGWEGRWGPAGWLWGLAIAFQPLVILILPVMVAVTPAGRRLALVVKAAVPSCVLVAVPMVQSWHNTVTDLVAQPTPPGVNHPTPLLPLAPVIARGPVEVGGGVPRLLALAFAIGLGLWVWRRRPSRELTLWCCVLALSLRPVFDAVGISYYLWPTIALALVIAATGPRWRLWAVVAVGATATAYAEASLSPWAWWLPICGAIGVMLALTWTPAARPASRGAGGGASAPGQDRAPVG